MKNKQPKTGQPSTRSFLADLGTTDDGSIELSISSNVPYQRQFGYEVLDHSPESVDLTRLMNGASVRNDHDGPQVGVVQKAWLDGTGKLRASIKFSKGQLGSEIEQDVKDGIRRNVSIGYQVLKWDNPKERAMIDGVPVFTATRWAPFHVAIVPDPADPTVGFNRALTPAQIAVLQEILDSAGTPDDSTSEITEDPTEEATETPAEEAAEEAPAGDTVEVCVEVTLTDADDADPTDETKSMESNTQELLTNTTTKAEEVPEADSNTPTPSANGPTFSQETRTMNDNVSEVVNPNIKLTDKEQKQYSLARAIYGLQTGVRSGFEFDISQDIASKTGKETAGFYMPTSVRSFSIGDSSTGGALTMAQPGEFLDYLRNRAQVAKLGADVMSLPGKLALPKLGGDIAATWVSEDGSGATISSASLSQVILSPKKLIAYTGYSLETLRVANYSIDAIVTDNMYKSLTVAFDKAAIQGTGTTQPTGILNQAGLLSGSFTSGSAITFAAAVDCWSKVAQNNADQGSLAFLTTPQVASQASTTIRAGSTAQFIMSDNKQIYGYDVAVSNNVPTSSGHYLIFGDWSACMMAEFGAIDVTIDPYSSKHKGLVEVSAALLGDIEFKQVSSFAILKNINA